jgi:peptidoglycan LD-endopeptidase LytH
MNLAEILKKHREDFHPLFNPDLTLNNTLMMNFRSDNPEMASVDYKNILEMNAYVFGKIRNHEREYGYGGYMEDRDLYRRSEVFDVSAGESRSIHLGVDVWTEAGKPVYCPLDGSVHSFQDNANYGDYGPTIIMEHKLNDSKFYTLYGHLSADSLEGLSEGKSYRKGEVLCRVGNFPVNGDWPPHLHFQVIADMMGKKGDFPGVCSKGDKEKFMEICPDPRIFFNF